MPRVIVALIRHGDYHQLPDTPSAHQPFPLTAKGEQQAVAAVTAIQNTLNENQWLPDPELDSSQLLRAWQTAHIIAKGLFAQSQQSPQVACFDDLAERCVGSAANLTMQQIKEVLATDPRVAELPADWKSNSHYRLPLQGAESLMDAGRRVANHLLQQTAEMHQRIQHDTVKLVVGHGAAFRHAAYQLGVLAFADIARLSMYHAIPVYLEALPNGDWRHIAGAWKVRGKHSSYTD